VERTDGGTQGTQLLSDGVDRVGAAGADDVVAAGSELAGDLGAPGLVLNALVLFDTRYMDAAVNQLRADGFDVRDEDVARLSPFVRHPINMLGRYSFQLPDLPGGLRPLRDPDAADE
jgi:hypothetical protein